VNDRPLVTVALPCYQAERHVTAALESLTAQTYPDLEIVAVDDGSTDRTAEILGHFANRDRRIRILCNAPNAGLIATLNRCVGEARGELIARMDADDLCVPERIERQVAFLRSRPDVGVVGSGSDLVASEETRRLRPRPVRCREPGGARFMALFATPVTHATIMGRAAVLRAHPYGVDPDSLHTEDYELFARMISADVGFANIDEPLVTVRVDPDGVSLRHEQLQVENFVRCTRRHIEATFGRSADAGAHRVLVNRMNGDTTARSLARGLTFLEWLETASVERDPGAAAEIGAIADMQRVDILVQAALKGSPALRAAAIALATRYARQLGSPAARRYLAGKLPLRGVVSQRRLVGG